MKDRQKTASAFHLRHAGHADLPRPQYRSFVPDIPGEFPVQWENCFTALTSCLASGSLRAFRVHVFLRSAGREDFEAKQERIRHDFYQALGEPAPPLHVVAQTPEHQAEVVIEAGFYPVAVTDVLYRSCNGTDYCLVRAGSYSEYWFTGIRGKGRNTGLRESADEAFSALQTLFEKTALSMNGIVRQWNYIGGILERRFLNGNMVQHYQLFNEARHVFYGKYREAAGYPAATGIGMDTGGVVLDCCVISGDETVGTCAVSNPIQQDSYAYGQDVLVGAAGQEGGTVKHPPQFERAMLIMAGSRSRLLISGTASIRGQENIAEGDVLQQTRITLENIRQLASAENLKAQCPALESVPDQYTYARVYVKHQEDIGRISRMCRDYFGDAPLTMVQADICRDDLLVEIETELTS